MLGFKIKELCCIFRMGRGEGTARKNIRPTSTDYILMSDYNSIVVTCNRRNIVKPDEIGYANCRGGG